MSTQKLLKLEQDGFVVEFETSSVWDDIVSRDSRMQELERKINDVDSLMEWRQQRIDELNQEIELLTNHADGLDCAVSVASGLLCGLIDSFFVGEFSFDAGTKWGQEVTEDFVKKVSKLTGGSGDNLQDAVSHLEKRFKFVGDEATNAFGGGRQHHLRDFSHHGSIFGLFFSLLTQFTGKVYGTSTSGAFIAVDVSDSSLIGDSLPTKIAFGIIRWFFHLVSDVAGSSSSIAMNGVGTGIPGPIMSLAKTLSALPFFQHDAEGLSTNISKIFNGTYFAERDDAGNIIKARPFDLRAELGVLQQLGKQAIPVIINECIVRSFYFIRRLMNEVKEKDVRGFSEIDKVDWNKVYPWKNRTITRMLTIATGTFTAFDLIDASVRAAAKSGGVAPVAIADVLLHVNFVGVGRFAIAVFSDVKMGFEKKAAEKKIRDLELRQLESLGVKLFYCQGECWVMADNCLEAYKKLAVTVDRSIARNPEIVKSIQANTEIVADKLSDIAKDDPKFAQDLLDELF